VVPSYDSAGRLASLTTSWGTSSYSYSPPTGQLAQITAPDLGKLNYAYDGSLLTDTSWSGAIAGTVHRSYDNFFRVASETVSGGPAISYQYNADGLLSSAGALQIQRDPATGFVTGSALGGTTESRTYDPYGAEASYTASFGGSNLYSVTYTRDTLGRIASKTERLGSDPSHTFSYGYDLAGRLVDVSKDGMPTSQYAYDTNGDRIAGPGLTSTPTYDAQDRLLSYGACSYFYKPGGELMTKTCPGGTTTYDYDAFGNLRHVALPNGTQIDYVIDGQNRRVGKKVNGVLVEGFIYRNQLQPTAWLKPDGSVRATFVYGLHSNVPEYMAKSGTTYRLITDQIGSVRLVVDAGGNVAERIDYDEFGNALFDTAPGFQPFGFAGGQRDMDTALVRFGARDYDSTTGRWMAKDPLRFTGGLANLYGYVGADPVNRLDPLGLAAYCSYSIADGHLVCDDGSGKVLADEYGYSGAPGYKNEPSAMGIKDSGPLPPGIQAIGDGSYDSRKTGPATITLDQIAGWSFDRDDFRFHGDSTRHPGSASNGCVVVGRRTRDAIAGAGGGFMSVSGYDLAKAIARGLL
jgi:RHS repeat-associated protein